MSKIYIVIMSLFLASFAHAEAGTPDAIVSGNENGGKIHLFGAPAGELFAILQATAATKEDVFGCIEYRSQNIVCGENRFSGHICVMNIDSSGNVAENISMVCPRP